MQDAILTTKRTITREPSKYRTAPAVAQDSCLTEHWFDKIEISCLGLPLPIAHVQACLRPSSSSLQH